MGSTVNPKIGFSWDVTDAVRIRGSYGTSFRAPTIAQFEGFSTRGNFNPILEAPNGMAGMGTATFFNYLAGPDLQPQEAEHWSIGLDAQLLSDFGPLQSLSFNGSYVNIAFDDQIARSTGLDRISDVAGADSICGRTEGDGINSNLEVVEFFTHEVDENGNIDPTRSQCFIPIDANLAAVDGVSTGVVDGVGSFTVDEIGGVSASFLNLSKLELEGLQLGLRSNWDTPIGALTASINATNTITYDAQTTTGDPVLDLIGRSGTGAGPTTANVRAWRGTFPVALRWNDGLIPFFTDHQTTLTYRFDTSLRNFAGVLNTGANNSVDLRHTFRIADDYSVALTVRNINGFERDDPTPALGSGDRLYQLQFTYAPRQGRGMGR